MNKQPKPCPFCGWGTIVDEAFWLPNKHICKCNACGARTKIYPTWNDAVKAWNRRAEQTELQTRTDKDGRVWEYRNGNWWQLSKTESDSEKPNNCDEPQYEMGMGTLKCDNCSEYGSFKCAKCDGEMYFKRLEPKDEPQTEREPKKGNAERRREGRRKERASDESVV